MHTAYYVVTVNSKHLAHRVYNGNVYDVRGTSPDESFGLS